jgi:hypothetical protein
MLRCAGIPARQVYVSLNADILHGLDVPGPYVDHSYTEVYLNNSWLKVDAYVVDKDLFQKSMKKVKSEGRMFGYGVHSKGTCEWDGESDAFAQCNGTLTEMYRQSWGPQIDNKSFYAQSLGQSNNYPLFFPMNLIFGLLLAGPNAKIDALRKQDFTAE